MPRKNKNNDEVFNPIEINEINELLHARTVICERLERFELFLNNSSENIDIFQLEIRLKSVEEDFSEFDKVQTRLEFHDKNEKNYRLDTESLFYSLISNAKRIIAIENKKSDVKDNSLLVGSRAVAKLPDLGLPVFVGKYENWYSFRDIFYSVVHNRTDLSEIDKFLYLKLCCKDDALKLIESLDATAANYSIALEILKKRYDNRRAIINHHVNSILFNLPNVTKESPTLIRKLVDTLHQHTAALEKLNLPVNQWDTLLIPIVLQKLDDRTKREWENKQSNQNLPTIEELTEFLSKKCFALEAITNEFTKFSTIKSSINNSEKPYMKPINKELSTTRRVSFPVTENNQDNNYCCICKGAHFVYRCHVFSNLSLSEKYDEIRKHKLCSNCLRTGHWKNECMSSGCKKCELKHNTLLHVDRNQNNNNYSSSSQNYYRNRNNGNNASPTQQQRNRVTNVSAKAIGEVTSPPQSSRTAGAGAGGADRFVNHHANHSAHSSRPTMRVNERSHDTNLDNHDCEVNSNQSNQSNDHITTCSYTNIVENQVLLSTATVLVQDSKGKWIKCHALLDSGSQSNLISQSLVNKLKLQCQTINIPLSGINQIETKISSKTCTKVKSRFVKFERSLSFLILPSITERLPIVGFNKSLLNIPKDINLADENVNEPKEIDLLLGSEVFYDLLQTGKIRLGPHEPILQETCLGWVLVGPFNFYEKKSRSVCNLSKISNKALHESLTKFWDLEEFENKPFLSQNEKYCADYFNKTTTRNHDGRFNVKYPFNPNNEATLGDSKSTALKRFRHLETRFVKDDKLKTQYVQFMREYIDLGHMTPIGTLETDDSVQSESYFMPHSAVIRNTALTTKCRVVFDASAQSSNGTSFNDLILAGPTIQPNLFTILLNLRLRNVVLSADIKMMYRCILIDESERSFQKILWRENTNDPIIVFNLNTVTYGTSSAPWQATRCLKELADLNREKYPRTAKIIDSCFYMDDLLTSVDSQAEAVEIFHELTEILNSAKFELRKWSSNDVNLLNYIDSQNVSSNESFVLYHNQKDLKTLGIIWDAQQDKLKFNINLTINKNKITKRTILSTVAQIFDPLGLIGPAVIKAKLIIQQLWHLKLDWDQTVPKHLEESWIEFISEIHVLNQIKVNRHVLLPNCNQIEMYGFSDSSERAYGCVVYLASCNSNGYKHIQLLTAKSKVAPIKKETLPRLELLAAHLLAKLIFQIKQTLNINIVKTTYFTDSTIVLSWLKIDSAQLKTFVANRVSKIMEISSITEWKHVRSKDNVADIISRGLNPIDLLNSEMWFNGPEFLKFDSPIENESFEHNVNVDLSTIPELKTQRVNLNAISKTVHTEIEEFDHFKRYSSFLKLIRVTAYILRFKNQALKKSAMKSEVLTVHELEQAVNVLIRKAQSESFKSEISFLKKGNQIENNSQILTLHPFLDNNGILRIGGRLSNANLSYDQQHPIILPYKHKLTELIIINEHKKNAHVGAQTLLSLIRLKFWPIKGKNMVKKIVHSCLKCVKANPKPCSFLMGDLPSSRVTPSRPFSTVGVDYAGPVYVKENTSKRSRLVKTYLAIFVCFSTRAVHIELANNLSTNSFINVLQRFSSRRGKPNVIHSDNGLNFVGANNYFIELHTLLNDQRHNDSVATFLANDKIKWCFIPARSPHMGGLWEAAVKSTKFHLKRVIGDASLYFEEMYTLLVRIEAILNSRPLTPMSNDVHDFLPLTPSHFLIGDTLLLPPDEHVQDIATNRLDRYQRLRQIFQQFWDRWSKEYLTNLQTRSKWMKDGSLPVKIGSLVVLVDDNLPPLRWSMARVTDVHPGADKVIRVVSVRLPNGNITRRSLKKICVLPVEDEISNEH